MRRDLKVNDGQESDDDPAPGGEFTSHRWPGIGKEVEASRPLSPTDSGAGKFGNCLYFGPAGERCHRLAGESGFCREHSGNREEADPRKPGKILAAVIGILALLWPVIGDVVQFILRWLGGHH